MLPNKPFSLPVRSKTGHDRLQRGDNATIVDFEFLFFIYLPRSLVFEPNIRIS